MTAPLVSLVGLVARYDAGPPVLNGIDLEIERGASIAVLGPSGCGKSTLLHVLGGLLPASSGTVSFEMNDLAELNNDELADLRNREIGYVFQDHHLLPQCTAIENVLVPTLVHDDKAARRAAVDRGRALLEQVGLGAHTDHRPSQLSGGECQRVAVVRALINRPRLLLADEPTGSLDADAADQLGAMLTELVASESVTLVTVTHSERLAHRMKTILELRNGALHPASS